MIDDAERTRALRRMKAAAAALLVAALVIFVVARSQHGDPAAWEYVEAAAEAAAVGALADWFAVTALFRRPLGLPIPHTAIIPTRKDQIGRSLGEFVERNFASHEVIGDRLRQADIARRVGTWLAQPANAERAAAAAADGLASVLTVLDDSEIRAGVERVIGERVAEVPAAPLLGRAIEVAIEGGHHQRLLDAIVQGAATFLEDNHDVVRALVDRESPWWIPELVDARIVAKIHRGVQRFLADVRADPTHEVRADIERRLVDIAARLRSDPVLRARGEELKAELLAHPQVRAWLGSLWDEAKAGLLDASARRDSELRVRTVATLRDVGERVANDPQLRARLNGAIERVVEHVVDTHRAEVSRLIESTIERWDGAATSRKLELQVGRDLQFIRINGTVVGAVAGLAIHAIAQLAL